jgi:putative ABC transport system substrate-binding protein
MRRRDFIKGVAGLATAWPLVARAQQEKSQTIGYLSALSEAADRPRRAAFAQRLDELGWVDVRNVRIEYRWADGLVARANEVMPEFVRLSVLCRARRVASNLDQRFRASLPRISSAMLVRDRRTSNPE